MTISEQKRLIKRFYLVSLLLNVVLPLSVSYMIIGDSTGEIQYVFIVAVIWAIVNTISYTVYFLIPGFENKRDKIATLFFPSILLFGLCIVEFGLFYILPYTLVINVAFFLYWNRKYKRL
nr:hypothetical protein [uncultured Psychroserpens sp.]